MIAGKMQEIELTTTEKTAVFLEQSRNHSIEDIACKIRERATNDKRFPIDPQMLEEMPEGIIEDIACKLEPYFDKAINNNESYFESYWLTVDEVLDEHIQEII